MRIGRIRIAIACAFALYEIAAPSLTAADSPGPAPELVGGGEITGTVTVTVPAERAPRTLSPYARRRYEPPVAPQSTASPDNVVVYVITQSGPGNPAPAGATIVQRQRTIAPRVIAVQAGARVRFPNEDKVFHNLFSLSKPRPFNLGRYAPGDSRSLSFDRPGIVRIYCDIHSEMSATVLVLDTPYFAIPDENGSYRIQGVPAGRHTLVAWHESAGTVSMEIVVSGSEATHADLRLPE